MTQMFEHGHVRSIRVGRAWEGGNSRTHKITITVTLYLFVCHVYRCRIFSADQWPLRTRPRFFGRFVHCRTSLRIVCDLTSVTYILFSLFDKVTPRDLHKKKTFWEVQQQFFLLMDAATRGRERNRTEVCNIRSYRRASKKVFRLTSARFLFFFHSLRGHRLRICCGLILHALNKSFYF